MQWVREADVVVASSHARFFEPFAEDGVLRESPRVACEIAPTVHRPITAQQALEIGLVDDVVPLNLLQSTAARRARLP
jgi:enoyl-CoA hydratase/carnithine racemase